MPCLSPPLLSSFIITISSPACHHRPCLSFIIIVLSLVYHIISLSSFLCLSSQQYVSFFITLLYIACHHHNYLSLITIPSLSWQNTIFLLSCHHTIIFHIITSSPLSCHHNIFLLSPYHLFLVITPPSFCYYHIITSFLPLHNFSLIVFLLSSHYLSLCHHITSLSSSHPLIILFFL